MEKLKTWNLSIFGKPYNFPRARIAVLFVDEFDWKSFEWFLNFKKRLIIIELCTGWLACIRVLERLKNVCIVFIGNWTVHKLIANLIFGTQLKVIFAFGEHFWYPCHSIRLKFKKDNTRQLTLIKTIKIRANF